MNRKLKKADGKAGGIGDEEEKSMENCNPRGNCVVDNCNSSDKQCGKRRAADCPSYGSGRYFCGEGRCIGDCGDEWYSDQRRAEDDIFTGERERGVGGICSWAACKGRRSARNV